MVNRLFQLAVVVTLPILLLFISGCEVEETPTAPEVIPTELTPMGLNRLMVFQTEQWLNGGLTYNNLDSFRTDKTNLIWLGCAWVHDTGNDSTYWRNGLDGVWRLRFGTLHPAGLAERMFAFPARPGERWFVPSENDSVSLVSNSESVSVPAGTFDGCYRYRVARVDKSRIQTVWFKPGVGKVQDSWVHYVNGDTLTSSMKLRSAE